MASKGLRGIVAGKSSLSLVDGKNAKLLYRGYDIVDLARESTFEEIVYLLWYGRLPKKQELQGVVAALSKERSLTKSQIDLISNFPKDALPMEVLRTVVSYLSSWDPDRADKSTEANLRKGTRILAKLPAIVAAFHRARNSMEFVPAKAGLNTAAAFLQMLQGKEAAPEGARAMDVCFILHVDHEFNASTFAARVTAATLSDLYAAIVSAIGTLQGPLHGGANENVMRMLQEIGEVSKAEKYVHEALERGERIPGFGHPVYKTGDPRARILKEMSKKLGETSGEPQWYEISNRIQEVMMKERQLRPNVDFYSASTLHALGVPTDLFSTFFACSRTAGWIGHVLEQYADNRLIRPLSEYVGPRDLKYPPMESR